MEQYYIATEEGQTEGPYSFASLETFYAEGKINDDTLVCIAGGQEWVQFGTVLEQKWKVQAFQRGEATRKKEEEARRRFDEAQAQLNKPAWQKIHEQQDTRPSESEPLEITVEGLFQIMGILALLAGVVLLFSTAKDRQPVLGFIYLLSGAFSCLGCFWCAKVIKLLSRAVDLLSVIAKRVYNSGNFTDKQ
ncbi:DUF4339 domain-containing protein [Akkermansia sp. UBA3271]|uniref:DUF4339 domain-containing protein n=1 Tax=Akkermansia sp. UBA3271 TaxID=1945963 RepID=UPI0025BD573D|nr:DUF4339 domain-containing protein [Akkermansia sp. UBA3271]